MIVKIVCADGITGLGEGRLQAATPRSTSPKRNKCSNANGTMRLCGVARWGDYEAVSTLYAASGRCERGIEALRQYRREYDDKLKDWRRNPLHDWTSHGADALRTFACGYYEPTTSTTNPFRRRPPPPRMGTHWSA